MGNEVSKPQLYTRISKALPPLAPQYGINENIDWVDKGTKAFASEGDREQFICKSHSPSRQPALQVPRPHMTTPTLKKMKMRKRSIKLTIAFRRPRLPPNLKRHPKPKQPRGQTLLLAPPTPTTKTIPLPTTTSLPEQNSQQQSLAQSCHTFFVQRRARRRHALTGNPRRDRRKRRYNYEDRTRRRWEERRGGFQGFQKGCGDSA